MRENDRTPNRDTVLPADSRGRMSELLAELDRTDDEVAYMIDAADRRGELVLSGLDEALGSIPNLASRPVVLDAVLDVLLRRGASRGEPATSVAKSLAEKHPGLRDAIVRAAALSELLRSSAGAPATRAPASRQLPFEVGPTTPEGRRRYTVRDHAGAGSHGSVYLATDNLLSSPASPAYVAIKFLRNAAPSPLEQRELAGEAVRARRIAHPNVARVIDRGVADDGAAYVVGEYVDGPTLHEWIERSRPSPRDIVRTIAAVAEGLQAIHSAGLLHCDLKPANIVLDRKGSPKITDFGLARWRGEVTAGADLAFGTLGFSPPEQVRGFAPLTAASDVYSLGGVLLWSLTGRVPNGETPDATRRALHDAASPIMAPDALAAVADPTLRRICERALRVEPSLRYSSAAQISADLERWLRDEPLPWTRDAATRRAARWVRREKVAVCAAALFTIALGVMAVKYGRAVAETQAEATYRIRAEKNAAVERERADHIRRTIRTSLEFINRNREQMRDADRIQRLVLLDVVVGPELVRESSDPELWQQRIRLAGERSEALRGPSGEHTAFSLAWQQVQGIWLLLRDGGDRAVGVLSDNLAGWKKVTPNDVLGIDLAERLYAAAVVQADRPAVATDAAAAERVRAALEVLHRPSTALVADLEESIAKVLERARTGEAGPIAQKP